VAAPGVGAVAALTLTVVGFCLLTAVVIVLARTSTARWERAKRAPRAPRSGAGATRLVVVGGATRVPAPAGRRLVATLRRPGAFVVRLTGAALLLTASRHVAGQGRRPRRPAGLLGVTWPRRASRTAASTGAPADSPEGDPLGGALPLLRGRLGALPALRGAGGAGRRLLARTPRRHRPRQRGWLHRHGGPEEAPVAHLDADEGSTSR
jgi:hypothetical protein